MWPIKKYSILPSSKDSYDEELNSSLLSEVPKKDAATANPLKLHIGFAILHLVIAGISISSLWTFTPFCRPTTEVLRPLEFPGIAEAIEYKTIVFNPSGLGTRKHPVTPYEGPPTPERDLLWYQLVDVGMVALTLEQNKTLRYPTQPVSKTDDTPLIQLDVFHQLHCLNAIRKLVYGTDMYSNMDDVQDQIHVDHCLDYIRQVLMCHSDVTPIIHIPRGPGYNPLLPPWKPSFETPHTCRDFGKIHDWAKKANTTGYVIESYPGVDGIAALRVPVNKEHEGS